MLNTESLSARSVNAQTGSAQIGNKNMAISGTETGQAQKPEGNALQHQNWMLAIADHRCKTSFAQLFACFANKIRSLANRQLSSFQSDNKSAADEILQEVMTQVWRKAHLYHPDKGAVSTWVYTVTRNLCFDHMRKAQNKKELNLAEDIWPVFEQVVVEDEVFTDHLSQQKVLAKVAKLPEAQQQVVRGVFFQELSQEQLARQLGVPLGTVKSRLRLAMEKLKSALGDQHD